MQLEAILSSYHCHLGEEADSHLTTTSFPVVIESNKASPKPPLLHPEQPQLPQPLPTRPVLQIPHSFTALPQTHSTASVSFLQREAQHRRCGLTSISGECLQHFTPSFPRPTPPRPRDSGDSRKSQRDDPQARSPQGCSPRPVPTATARFPHATAPSAHRRDRPKPAVRPPPGRGEPYRPPCRQTPPRKRRAAAPHRKPPAPACRGQAPQPIGKRGSGGGAGLCGSDSGSDH